LAHYTASGIKEILQLDLEIYSRCLNSAIELSKLDKETIKRVVIVGYEKGE